MLESLFNKVDSKSYDVKVGAGPRDPEPRDPGTRDPPQRLKVGLQDSLQSLKVGPS